MPDLSWRGRRKLKSLREHGGKSALATVTEFDKRWSVPESGYGGIPLGHSEHYTLKIRVEPIGDRRSTPRSRSTTTSSPIPRSR